MQQKLITVSEVNIYLKSLIESDIFLQDIWITGELSNIKYYAKGAQVYFNLIDNQSQISAVIYQSTLNRLNFKLENGQKVAIRGKIKIWNKRGTYNLQVNYMILKGEGDLSIDFEKLKAKLQKQGLFDLDRKKSIPKFPENIAIITALDSAGMWDFISVIKKLAPNIQIYIIPAVMQGDLSPYSIIEALEIMWETKNIDVCVILRGGGSASDLSCFNNEKLVQEIAKSEIPIISAIGHEIDYTLVDFVADLRAKTPTEAGQILAQSYYDFQKTAHFEISQLGQKFQQEIIYFINTIKHHLKICEQNLSYLLNIKKQYLEDLFRRSQQANPLHKIQQGFSISRLTKSQKIIKHIKQVSIGEQLETQVIDGKIFSKVIAKQ